MELMEQLASMVVNGVTNAKEARGKGGQICKNLMMKIRGGSGASVPTKPSTFITEYKFMCKLHYNCNK